MNEFRLPDVGEGLTEADIVAWRVEVGDEVKVNDLLVDIETAKSIVELPSPFAGRIEELLVAEGDTVKVGTPIVRIGSGADRDLDTPLASRGSRSPDPGGERSETPIETTESKREPVLVGYGPRTHERREPRQRRRAPEPDRRDSVRVLAKPPVRKLAKDLGVDLASVPSDGDVVTRAEVEAFARGSASDLVTATPVTGVRRATAEAMVASVAVPQATEWVTIDVSATVELVDRLKADRRFENVKVTPTLVTARAVCLALRRTPDLHAKWRGDAIEHPSSVGLGVAAATDRGLVVPVVREADRLSLADLGCAIDDLVTTARAGRIQPSQLAGGTFSLTNVGVFGVDAGTPILPPDQTGILALGQIVRRPWVVDDQIVPRWVTTLAVTFDHRVVDGEQASRFMRDVADILGDPAVALAF